MVSDEEIADIFKHKNSLEDQGSALLGLALEHGGKDNITICLARREGDSK